MSAQRSGGQKRNCAFLIAFPYQKSGSRWSTQCQSTSHEAAVTHQLLEIQENSLYGAKREMTSVNEATQTFLVHDTVC